MRDLDFILGERILARDDKAEAKTEGERGKKGREGQKTEPAITTVDKDGDRVEQRKGEVVRYRNDEGPGNRHKRQDE